MADNGITVWYPGALDARDLEAMTTARGMSPSADSLDVVARYLMSEEVSTTRVVARSAALPDEGTSAAMASIGADVVAAYRAAERAHVVKRARILAEGARSPWYRKIARALARLIGVRTC